MLNIVPRDARALYILDQTQTVVGFGPTTSNAPRVFLACYAISVSQQLTWRLLVRYGMTETPFHRVGVKA